MLARTLHSLWLLAVALLFLVAVVLMAGRLLVPLLGEYRAEVENLAGQALQRNVSIGRMQGTWRRLNPVLRLKDVVISEPQAPGSRLYIREVWLALDVRNYLLEGEVRIASIDVIGADLSVIRNADGHLYIEHLTSESGSLVMPVLPDVDRLSIHDSVVRFEDRLAQRPALRFRDVTLRLDSAGGRHNLTGYALLPAALGQRIDVMADLGGSLLHPGQWSGQVYAEGKALAVTPENLRAIADDMDVTGIADVRVWAALGENRLQGISGELEINDLLLHQSGTGAAADYAVDRLAARFGWRRRESGWQFAAGNIEVGQGKHLRRGAGLSLAAHRAGVITYYSGNITRLFLQDLQSIVRSVPLIPEQQRQQLARLQPEGLVEELYVDLQKNADRIEVSTFNGSFRALGFQPRAAARIRGLNGSVTGASAAGAIWLHSEDAGYRDESLFRDELQFDRLAAEVAWRYQDGRLRIDSEDLVLENRDLALTGRLGLELPAGPAAPRLDLQAGISRAAIAGIRHYLPVHIMPASGVEWLERSLVSGEIHSGSVRLAGPLDKLPFDHGEGRLEVRLPVSNALLEFDPGWSAIRALDAQVNFSGRAMDIESHQGRIRSAALASVNARIADLEHPQLRLSGRVQGALPVMLAELGSSPLGELYGGFVDRVSSAGKARLDLDLFVPLHETAQDIDVKGRIELEGNTLALRQEDLGFSDIRGRLAFDTAGVTGKNLQARLLDAPVRVDVWTDNGSGMTNIGIQGPLDFAALAAQQQPELAALLSGRANWSLRLGIKRLAGRKSTPDVDLELASTLQGIHVRLPAPYGKPAEAVEPLSIRIERALHPDPRVTLRYGAGLEGVFSLHNTNGRIELLHGGLAIGGEEAALPDRRELSLTGRLERFALAEWLPVAAAFDGADARAPPLRLDLAIGTLDLYRYVLEDVTLRMIESGQVRYLRLEGPMASGSLQLVDGPAGLERVSADLDTLTLHRPASGAAAEGLSLDPAQMPVLDVAIGKLNVEGIGLGKLGLQTATRADGLRIERLSVVSDMLDISARGSWREGQGEAVSDIDITINDGKLETLLQELDYQEELSGGRFSGTLRASWPGAPWDFRPESLEGRLHLVIGKGRLLNVKPGAGRVFGLVSLHTLPRRLSLDFSDLFKKGFAFDHIEGSFVLNDGNAFTSDLYIEGPAARIDISGRIGLADKDYDELVTVVPHVSSSLPIAGAIAGGPVVGAALLVAEHLLGDELEKRTRFTHRQYTVTGPWSDPVYTPVSGAPEPEPAQLIGAPSFKGELE
jgi:uncharacterized protein (TIGR02099 family)